MQIHPPSFPPHKPRSPSHARPIHAWLWLGLLLLMPIQAIAEPSTAKTALDERAETATLEEPQFYIERISIEGPTRAAADLLIAESRLESGRVYSERELRRALVHLNRLPFVLDSAMALRRGSQRGRYELILEVIETKAFFYSSELAHTKLGTPLRLDGGDLTAEQQQSAQLSGWRFFVGPYSVVFAALSNNQGLQAGWTRYNLADRGILLSVDVSHHSCCPVQLYPLGLDPEFSSWTSDGDRQRVQFTLGVPVKEQQSLRLNASYAASDSGERIAVAAAPETRSQTYDDQRELYFAVTWLRDSTDDPLLPTRGSTLSAGLDFRRWSAHLQPANTSGPVADSRSRLVRATFGAAHHWPLGHRQSLAVSARLALGRSTVEDLPFADGLLNEDFNVWESTLALQHSLAIWNTKMQRNFGDLRWENTVSWSQDDLSADFGPTSRFGSDHGPIEQWRLQSALIFRNAWGIMRVGLTYLEFAELI